MGMRKRRFSGPNFIRGERIWEVEEVFPGEIRVLGGVV